MNVIYDVSYQPVISMKTDFISPKKTFIKPFSQLMSGLSAPDKTDNMYLSLWPLNKLCFCTPKKKIKKNPQILMFNKEIMIRIYWQDNHPSKTGIIWFSGGGVFEEYNIFAIFFPILLGKTKLCFIPWG